MPNLDTVSRMPTNDLTAQHRDLEAEGENLEVALGV
jgi:hypothetical protein